MVAPRWMSSSGNVKPGHCRRAPGSRPARGPAVWPPASAVTVAVRGTPVQQADLPECLVRAHLAQDAGRTPIIRHLGHLDRTLGDDVEAVGTIALPDEDLARRHGYHARTALGALEPVGRQAGELGHPREHRPDRVVGQRLHGMRPEQRDRDDRSEADDEAQDVSIDASTPTLDERAGRSNAPAGVREHRDRAPSGRASGRASGPARSAGAMVVATMDTSSEPVAQMANAASDEPEAGAQPDGRHAARKQERAQQHRRRQPAPEDERAGDEGAHEATDADGRVEQTRCPRRRCPAGRRR